MDKIVIEFLETLQANNNRDWFLDNKKMYESARKEVEQFVDHLIPNLLKIDPSIGPLSSKDTMFRIYRDVRFSKDKTPYKTYFGAFMAPGGRKSDKAGYYMHISPDDCFIGGGSHNPMGENLKKIRSEIFYNVDEFKSIINNQKFKSTFEVLKGEQLKRPPAGYPKDFPDMDLLKHKDFTVFQTIDKSKIVEPDFDKQVLGIFKTMEPFIVFLNRGLES
jgi:uncharacterized protein (TIGR02453 family)